MDQEQALKNLVNVLESIGMIDNSGEFWIISPTIVNRQERRNIANAISNAHQALSAEALNAAHASIYMG